VAPERLAPPLARSRRRRSARLTQNEGLLSSIVPQLRVILTVWTVIGLIG
jgi:hypothetical protein